MFIHTQAQLELSFWRTEVVNCRVRFIGLNDDDDDLKIVAGHLKQFTEGMDNYENRMRVSW